MDVVGEVERCRAARQIDYLALWGECVNSVLEQLGADPLEEVTFRIRLAAGVRGVMWLEKPSYPFDLALVLRVTYSAFLVGPVGGDAELGVLVHLTCSDLHLHTLSLRT